MQRLVVAVVLVIILAGIVFFGRDYFMNRSQNPEGKDPQITNSQALDNGNNTPITSQSDVEYFPNARGYFVRPEAEGNYPGVVMIHENRGLRPEIVDTADQLAREGYMVLAVDLFEGRVLETQEQAGEVTASFNQEVGVQNMRAAADYLRERGATKIASLGWCFGGRQSVALAISGEPLDATVVYYGGNMASTQEELEPIEWPVLGVFGEEDQAIPLEKVREFETSLNALGVENEIYTYPGVGHAFANPSGENYAPEETRDAWEKTINFLNRHLKS